MNRSAVFLACVAAGAALAAPVPRPKSDLHAPGWVQVDPDKIGTFSRGADSLSLELPPAGPKSDARRLLINVPRYQRDVEGDFRMDVRVTGTFRPEAGHAAPPINGTAAGFLADLGGPNPISLRFEFGAPRPRGKESRYVTLKWLDEKTARASGTVRYDTARGWSLAPGEAYLRFERVGARFRSYYSDDGTKWAHLTTTHDLAKQPKLRVGLFACNLSGGAMKVTFDRFNITRPEPGRKPARK